MFESIHSTRPTGLVRLLCVSLSMAMFYSVASAGVHAAFQASWLQAEQVARRTWHFTERPKPLRPNFAPRRDLDRGIWNSQNRSILRKAEQIERLHAPLSTSDLYASIAPVLPLLLGDGGGEPGGGDPLPGEGGTPGGGSMPPLGVNTNTGNRKTTLPIVGWSARGQNGIEFTLYHNSKSDYMFDLGKGWSHSYDMSLVPTDPNNLVLRLANGWVLPYNISAFTYYEWNDQTQAYDAHQGNAWSGPSQLPWLDVVSPALMVDRKDPANPVEYHFSTSYASPQDPNAIPRLMMVKDKYGNTTTISRNSAGRMTSVSDGTGRSLTFSGPLAGRIESVTAPTGKVWTFTYSGDNLTHVGYPALGSVSPTRIYGYNATNDITSEVDLNGNTWSYTYNSNQELASATDPLGKTWVVNWNGGTVTITSPMGRVTTDVYNNGVLTHHTDEAGFFETYQYDPHNQLVQFTDKQGNISKTRRVWRNGGFVVSKQIDALNRTTTFTYNTSGTIASITDPLNRTVTATYDSNNDIISAVDPLGRTAFINTYNGFGELTSVQDGMGRTASISRDSYGNVVQAVDPANVVSSATYNLLGVPLSATDGAGSTYSLGYDDWFRPVQVTVPGNATSSLAYDFEGNVLSATDPLGRTGYRTYNARGEVISTTNAKGESHTYSYNDDGLLIAVTNGRNFTRTYNHTLRGEVTSLTLPDGAVEQWAYDAPWSNNWLQNPLGQTILYV
ncbi:DUF6531 domain-containing protein [Geitlerinema splendidum]|nr:DUF6531 domain-containing protein [Geitlerinema splendidum]